MGMVLNEEFAYESRMDVIFFCNKKPWSCTHGTVVEEGYTNGEIWAKINLDSAKFSGPDDMVLILNANDIPFMGEVVRCCDATVRIGIRLK